MLSMGAANLCTNPPSDTKKIDGASQVARTVCVFQVSLALRGALGQDHGERTEGLYRGPGPT